jgi:hypothetical protein
MATPRDPEFEDFRPPGSTWSGPKIGCAFIAVLVGLFVLFVLVRHLGKDWTAESWEKALCRKTLVAYDMASEPLPSYIAKTCGDVIERNKSGAKWRNEAGQCSTYQGVALVKCMNRVFE